MAKILIYVLGFVLLGLVVFALRERLGKRAFKIFAGLCVALFIVILGYEFGVYQKSKQNEALLLAFSNGKALLCKDASKNELNVSVENFNYDYGTKSFISKEKGVKAQIFSIKECEFNE